MEKIREEEKVLLKYLKFYQMIKGAIENINYSVLIGTGFVGVLLFFFFYNRFFKRELNKVDATWQDFAWVFFWSIFTHPLLDCCTTYGTQLFQPFSDYRVGFNNVAVADLFYTLPFLLCLIGARLFLKNTFYF